jgi:hypothetical protein
LRLLQENTGLLFTLTRWLVASARNAVRRTIAQRPGDVLFVSAAGLFLAGVQLAGLHDDVSRHARVILRHWRLLGWATAGLVTASGYYAGARLGLYASRLSRSAWLAVLPLPEPLRREAAWRAAVLLGCIPAVLLPGLIMLLAHAVGVSVAECGVGALCLFAAAFLLASRLATASGVPVEAAGVRRDLGGRAVLRLMARCDRARPRWLGVWAIGERRMGLALLWGAGLVLLGGAAGIVSLAQHWAWPSLVASVAGGHVVFVAALDTRPLLSPGLRCQPLPYAGAVAGLLRLPLCASFAWFAVAVLPAVVLPGAIARLPAAALALLVVDLYFAACLCAVSPSRRQGLVLYAVGAFAVLQQAAEYGMAYGWLASGAVAAIAVYLVSRARRRFRAHA